MKRYSTALFILAAILSSGAMADRKASADNASKISKSLGRAVNPYLLSGSSPKLMAFELQRQAAQKAAAKNQAASQAASSAPSVPKPVMGPIAYPQLPPQLVPPTAPEEVSVVDTGSGGGGFSALYAKYQERTRQASRGAGQMERRMAHDQIANLEFDNQLKIIEMTEELKSQLSRLDDAVAVPSLEVQRKNSFTQRVLHR